MPETRLTPGRFLAAAAALAASAVLAPAAAAHAGAARLQPSRLAATAISAELRAPAAVSSLTANVARPAARTPRVGTVRTWLGLDDERGVYYPKPFRLAGVGARVEVWIAHDVAFPEGDCRNGIQGGARLRITQAAVRNLVRNFDRNIYPKESRVFSVPPRRDGSRATANRAVFNPTGDGRKVVVLVDNVRDDNYRDLDNSRNGPYIAGFFSSDLLTLFDRNVVTVDSYDWLHRTGANPPHEPVPNDFCASAPGRPFLYESVLAHEYQHLLAHYEDRDEETFVEEGLADYAQTITGYVNPRRPIDTRGHSNHVQCFLGWLSTQTAANPNPRPGGPENSLTRWGDTRETLCDYGAAYTFMEFLAGRYGQRFMTALHRDDANGLAGVQRVLTRVGARTSAQSVIHDWAAMVALDAVLDRGARVVLHGGRRAAYRTPTLAASINWDNPRTHSARGAPPNGSDYVRLRDASGRYLSAAALETLSFSTVIPRGQAEGRGITLQLVGYPSAGLGTAYLARVPLGPGLSAQLDRGALQTILGDRVDVVAAIVTFDDPGGTSTSYAPYTLSVNGVVQPGG